MNETEHTAAGPQIAIVGAGPAGCYTAQFLRKRWPDAGITIFDRHAEPYGLIRYGVAPDHLGTKAISKQFDRLFSRDRVHFVSGIDVGTDVSLEQLRVDFDVVVLATGLWQDRTIEGFHTVDGVPAPAGVYGAGYLTRLINGHPDETSASLRIGRRTVVVGNGNVAVDLVRLMLSSPAVLRSHGVSDDVIRALTEGPLEHVHVVGRSPLEQAKFDPAMVRELAKLPDVRFTADSIAAERMAAAAEAPTIAAVRGLVDGSPEIAGRSVSFHFGWTPERVRGGKRVEEALFRSTHEQDTLTLAVDSVCTAIGFTEASDAVLRRDTVASSTSDLTRGQLAEGLYCVGWFRRGPVGTIPANRADARIVADTIITDLGSAPRRLAMTIPMTEELR